MSAGGWNLWTDGSVGQPVRIAAPASCRVVLRAWGSPAAGVWPEMALLVDGRAVDTVFVERADPQDCQFTVDLTAGIHEIAAAFLNDAVTDKEDRNLYLQRITIRAPAGGAEPALLTAEELAEAAEAREREIVAGTRPAIEKHRKTDATIRVVDAGGGPVAGAKVSVEQTGHDFLFGCNVYSFDRYRSEEQNVAYKRRFEELFNYATVGFYWRWYEPERVTEIMRRYQGKIEFWEVVNEPSHLPHLKIDEPYRWARQADPQAYLIVNDYHVLADGCPGFFRLLSKAKQDDVPFNGIGIQAHEPRTMRFPLDRVQEILDHYASLGKELHITEYTPTSAGQRITGSHRQGVWDEAAQADYAVKFYGVAFAHPAVRAVTWWDLCDQGSWLPGGGMLRKDMSPKPVYDQLKHLIHDEWKTRDSGATDDSGRFAFRGFFGSYRIVIEAPGGSAEKVLRLKRGEVQELNVTLAAAE
jgi:endo-1,4-beta-xylanase